LDLILFLVGVDWNIDLCWEQRKKRKDKKGDRERIFCWELNLVLIFLLLTD